MHRLARARHRDHLARSEQPADLGGSIEHTAEAPEETTEYREVGDTDGPHTPTCRLAHAHRNHCRLGDAESAVHHQQRRPDGGHMLGALDPHVPPQTPDTSGEVVHTVVESPGVEFVGAGHVLLDERAQVVGQSSSAHTAASCATSR